MIFGESGSRCCVVNGAAARTCQVGDQIIVCSSTYVNEAQIAGLRPKILAFDRNNHIIDRLTYSVTRDSAERYCFEIRDEEGDVKPVPLRTADSN